MHVLCKNCIILRCPPDEGVYWTSNEVNGHQVFTLQSRNGLLMETSKGGNNFLRPILAF